jgi:prevent-host-death family protein
MIVTISKAKIDLSKLVNRACHGERIIITKNNLPLAEIVPHNVQGKRILGIFAGKVALPDNIMDEDEEVNEMFYGKAEK